MNEAEKAVIGCLLVNQQAQPYILDAITGEDFSDPELGEVYDKLASLWARHRKLDTVSAASVMGKELLAECADQSMPICAKHLERIERNGSADLGFYQFFSR